MKYLRSVSGASLLLVMAASCAGPGHPLTTRAGSPKATAASTYDSTKCKARGGKMLALGMTVTEQCVTPFDDGGTTCTDSSQCEGMCQLRDNDAREVPVPDSTGLCTISRADNFGCYSKVVDGVAGSMVCVD